MQEGFGWTNGVVLHFLQKYNNLESPFTLKGKIEKATSDLYMPIGIAIAWTNADQESSTKSWFKIEGKSYIDNDEFTMAMESSEEIFEVYGESTMKFGTGKFSIQIYNTKYTLFKITCNRDIYPNKNLLAS